MNYQISLKKIHNTPSTKKVSIPLMITKKMRVDLLDKGYSQAEIKNMNPSQCWELLNHF